MSIHGYEKRYVMKQRQMKVLCEGAILAMQVTQIAVTIHVGHVQL